MPRSGTSLLTSLLHGLGVGLGEKLAPPDVNNPAGYWEHEEICQTQERLLQQFGRRWIDPTGTLPFPSKWWTLPEVKPFKKKLTAIVVGELSKHDQIWGFKDPRTSRLIPLWREIFAELQLEPIYMLALREPASAVESMMKLYGIPAAHAELLWLLHTLDAVRDAGDRLQTVVEFDRWFTEPREQINGILRALNAQRPVSEEALLASIRGCVRPDLRHFHRPRLPSLPFVAEVHDLLQRAVQTGKIPREFPQLDETVRRALALCLPWNLVVEELIHPRMDAQFSFVDHFAAGRLEPLGKTAQAAIWDARFSGAMHRAIFLHPPARLHFCVPDGRRARLTFGVCVHPDAWNKPRAGGCEFSVTVNSAAGVAIRVDPVHVASDRQWHECALDIPESATGSHKLIFETRALGDSLDFRWAVWREPRLIWKPDVIGQKNLPAALTAAPPAIVHCGVQTKPSAPIPIFSPSIFNSTAQPDPRLSPFPVLAEPVVNGNGHAAATQINGTRPGTSQSGDIQSKFGQA